LGCADEAACDWRLQVEVATPTHHATVLSAHAGAREDALAMVIHGDLKGIGHAG
jgi:hypothetical protein